MSSFDPGTGWKEVAPIQFDLPERRSAPGNV
jgi:hypothetical protein